MRKPYVILIGSASGIGKSTIAAELAKKLNTNINNIELPNILEKIERVCFKGYKF